MKPEEVKGGEIYWLRFPDKDPDHEYYGRFLVTSKGNGLAIGKRLDKGEADSSGSSVYFYWRLLKLEDHAALLAMGNILAEIHKKLSTLMGLDIDTSVLQQECSRLRLQIAKELKGAP